jgi:hypothetical protein
MRQQEPSRFLGCFVKRRRIMTDKAKLALVAAVTAVIFASPTLAQTINGGDETGNASPYSYQPAASDTAVRHAGALAVMSALGQKQTFAPQNVMLPPKADMCGATSDVR